jgi:hypothetical protein
MVAHSYLNRRSQENCSGASTDMQSALIGFGHDGIKIAPEEITRARQILVVVILRRSDEDF